MGNPEGILRKSLRNPEGNPGEIHTESLRNPWEMFRKSLGDPQGILKEP